MIRTPPLALVALALVAPAQAATPTTSWGKPGVSIDQYRADAVDCGKQGYYQDISATEQAQAYIAGSRLYDRILETSKDPQQIAMVVRGVNPEKRSKELREILTATVAQCLTARGYRRFALTPDQDRRLAKLKPGSDARRAYMHALASDAAVLAAQGERTDRHLARTGAHP